MNRSSFLILTPPLVIKLRIFRNRLLFFSYFYVGSTITLIPVQISKRKKTQEFELILLFSYTFQISKHVIVLPEVLSSKSKYPLKNLAYYILDIVTTIYCEDSRLVMSTQGRYGNSP